MSDHIPDVGKMPDACPFCGAGVLILEDGQECRTPDGSHLAFQCFTNWFRDRPANRTDECVKAERNNLIAERDRLRGLVNRLVKAGDIMLASTTEIGAREAILRWIDVATEAKP